MNLTPAMQQYYDLKEQKKDCILFFRMGDFYEMFDEDAKIAHRILWINLTSRNKNAENPIPLAWIPYHAKEKYLPKLIKAWYRVAIAEQVSDSSLKGIVKREIVRVVSPWTLHLEEEWDSSVEISHSICSITYDREEYWLSIINLDTRKWICSSFEDFSRLQTELYKISPSEMILEKTLLWNSELEEILKKKYNLNIYFFDAPKNFYKFLCMELWAKNLEGIGIEKNILAQKASSILLSYLKENQSANFDFLDSLYYENFHGYMGIDEATIKSLDLVFNYALNSKSQGTLYGVLNHTKTVMGKRRLRHEILHPLQDKTAIQKRQEYISLLKNDTILLENIQSELKNISDIDAILSRISLERSWVKDLISLKNSLKAIKSIMYMLDKSSAKKVWNIFKT